MPRHWLVLLCAMALGCSGNDLSTQQLSQVVDAQRPTLETCYNDALEGHPYKKEVHLDAVIHVAPSGAVSDVELKGRAPLPGLSSCLREAIEEWSFPRAQEPTSTSLPLVFKPEVVEKSPDEAAQAQ